MVPRLAMKDDAMTKLSDTQSIILSAAAQRADGNVLPLPGVRWESLERRVAAPHGRALVLHLDEYENRFVLAGDGLPKAAEASRAVRAALRRIGSSQASRLSVRTLRA